MTIYYKHHNACAVLMFVRSHHSSSRKGPSRASYISGIIWYVSGIVRYVLGITRYVWHQRVIVWFLTLVLTLVILQCIVFHVIALNQQWCPRLFAFPFKKKKLHNELQTLKPTRNLPRNLLVSKVNCNKMTTHYCIWFGKTVTIKYKTRNKELLTIH